MANSNVKFGLKPIGVVGGVAGTTGATPYFIKSDASAMFQGSPVIATNDGTIAITGSATGDTYKHLGVFAGCEYVDATSGEKKFSNYWPGSGSTFVLINLDFNTASRFEKSSMLTSAVELLPIANNKNEIELQSMFVRSFGPDRSRIRDRTGTGPDRF